MHAADCVTTLEFEFFHLPRILDLSLAARAAYLEISCYAREYASEDDERGELTVWAFIERFPESVRTELVHKGLIEERADGLWEVLHLTDYTLRGG